MAIRKRMRARNPNLALAVALVSVLSVMNSFFAFIFNNPNVREVLVTVTEFLSIFFLSSFLYRLAIADSKTRYMVHQEGWVDLLACIPFFQISWVFRGLRAFFTFRRLSFRQAREDVRREGAEFALFMGIFFVIIVI